MRHMKPYQRKLLKHLSANDTKTLSQQTLKLCEEAGELASVVLPYDDVAGTKHRFVNKVNIIEESIDVILCAMSILNNIDCSISEYDDMLDQKLIKWDSIQQKESQVGDNTIPFEIHITVQILPTMPIAEFQSVCESINVKPIILDLMLDSVEVQHIDKSVQDIMTSSVHVGSNKSVRDEKDRIVTLLEVNGYNVIREKIETVPWHPLAPQLVGEYCSTPGTYFECHFAVLCSDETHPILEKFASENDVHLSRNIFKKMDDRYYTIMLTHRSKLSRVTFDDHLSTLRQGLDALGLDVIKEIKEFALYDNAVHHDDVWING